MDSSIEQTVKALVEFESQLEKMKSELLDAGRRTMKDAADWAGAARSTAISRAQETAARNLAVAKEQAEAEADRIKRKGESDLKAYETSIAKNKGRASDLVASRLMGESD
jgi:vacuolar-type H+-ATPase subunit H